MRLPWILFTLLLVAFGVLVFMYGTGEDEGSVHPAVEATADTLPSSPSLETAPVPTDGPTDAGTRRVVPTGSAPDAAADGNRATASEDGALYGRVVADEDGRPLPGVEIHAQRSGRSFMFASAESSKAEDIPPASTDERGEFALPLAMWRNHVGGFQAAGRGSAFVRFTDVFNAPENRLEVRLARSARLVGRVVGGRPETRELWVRLETESNHLGQPDGLHLYAEHLRWRGAVESNGRFVIEDLPPDVPLEAELSSSHFVVRREPYPLTLAPGETREVEWRLEEGATVQGVALDEGNASVEGLAIWILPASVANTVILQSYQGPTAVATTDAEGRFEFADVPAGEWVVGPAPKHRPEDRPQAADAAPVATPVTIDPGIPTVDVVVRVHRGRFVDGLVLDPAGEPVGGCSVWAAGLDGGGFQLASADDDGNFRIGPLLPGRYSLTADASSEEHAASDPVEARDGAEGVILRLTNGGGLHGKVVDAETGKEVSAGVYCHPVDKNGYRGVTGGGSEFSLGGLTPGAYHLIAVVEDGRIGVLRDVHVGSGDQVQGLEIAVARGGRVRVRYDGPLEYGNYTLEQDGVRVAMDGLRTGTKAIKPVPVGTITARIVGHDRSRGERPAPVLFEREQTVQVSEGEEVTVVFEIEK